MIDHFDLSQLTQYKYILIPEHCILESILFQIQPTIIFIDEIDSILRGRNSSDHEATAMMKTQFMSLWDGLSTDTFSCRVIIMGELWGS